MAVSGNKTGENMNYKILLFALILFGCASTVNIQKEQESTRRKIMAIIHNDLPDCKLKRSIILGRISLLEIMENKLPEDLLLIQKILIEHKDEFGIELCKIILEEKYNGNL